MIQMQKYKALCSGKTSAVRLSFTSQSAPDIGFLSQFPRCLIISRQNQKQSVLKSPAKKLSVQRHQSSDTGLADPKGNNGRRQNRNEGIANRSPERLE